MGSAKLPPIKSTAGEGFAVEDRVAAWLACHLLSNTPWPNPEAGLIDAIGCQMRQDGWHFDDFIVELSRDGEAYRCACSVKSFPVFGVRGAPAEFSAAAWNEWLGKENSPFQRARDKLAIFTAPHAVAIREAWQGLLDSARAGTPPEIFARRQLEGAEPSPLRRDAFASMQCPAEVDTAASGDPTETARLLRDLYLQEQDFDHTDSERVKQALLMCQQALEDVARIQAPELWHAILVYAADIRNKGGRISLPGLLARLVPTFPLKQFPRYAEEWQRILQDSQQQLAALPATIGGTLSVERRRLVGAVSEATSQKRLILLVGDSGFGKTVLARSWAIAAERTLTVWVKASDLAAPGGLLARWGLRHELSALFANASKPARLVIDGLDKCFEEAAFNEAALLLKSAFAESARDRWLVVLTCSPDDWARVHRELIRRELLLDYRQVVVGGFTNEEVRKACERIPSLRPLWNHPHLHPILRWPKALDIAATHWRGSASPQWASESEFSRWFWSTAISRDQAVSPRDRVLRKLACALADRLSARVRLDEFSAEEVSTLLELARECHVAIDRASQTVRFVHDLVADWARLRELQIQDSQVAPFLRARLQSPFWHRALRFYALDVLEHSATAAEWQTLFGQFGTDDPACEIARNLLLEAPIFALRQRSALEQLWPTLIAGDGDLLRRFLRQFLRVATIPDERYVAHFRDKEPDLQLLAAVRYRLPWGPYWPGVIAFLGGHENEVIRHAREEIADACLSWLPLHEITPEGMRTAAHLAVAAGRLLHRGGKRGRSRGHDISSEEKVCAALFAAAPVLRDEVEALVLKLSGRRPPDPEDGLPVEERETSPSRFAPRFGPPQPWPEGPQVPCNPHFRKAFLDLHWPAPLMTAIPEVAEQVMFATLLNIPRAGSSPRDHWHNFKVDEHGFDSGDLRHRSPFWTSGPFLSFLRLQPGIALSAVIRLVNFATDRCLEIGADIREPIEVPITVDGETRIWRGHRYSYLWHQGHVFGPRAVCCALLSLEKWLYLLMDEGTSLDGAISTILRESRSIALAAVLVCIGKRRPEIFLGKLRPLLASAELYWVEETVENRLEGNFRASTIRDRSQLMREQLREWVEMPHRKETLSRFVLNRVFNDPQWQVAFEQVRGEWEARIAASTPENPAPEWLPRIAAQFDLQNWKPEAAQEGIRIRYEPPSDLPQPTPDDLERLELYNKLVLLPFECSRVLKCETACSEEQMAAWWNDLVSVRRLKVPPERRGLQDIEDALCGIVAVAVVRHRAWLAASPEREDEAIRILTEVGENPPGKFWFSEGDFCDFKWDIFAAWALTTLWTEAPEEPFLRQAVASFALWEREIVVDRVLRIAAGRRLELGRHFEQLFAHTIRYSPAKHCMFMERQFPRKTFNAEAWTRRHRRAFMEGRTEPLPASWMTIAQPQPWMGGQTSGMDLGHLKAALGWAEDLGGARGAAERAQWIEFHRQSLLCAVQRMRSQLNRDASLDEPWDDQDEELPFEDEEAFLERVSSILARLNPGEPHRLLWEPVLELGVDGSHWIDSFVSGWLIEVNRNDQVAPGFIEEWCAMMEFAESSPAWRSSSKPLRNLQDSWEHLLGLSPFGAEFWRIELQPAVEKAWPCFERWARRSVGFHYCACTFIRFLKTPAAEGRRLDGLRLLKECVRLDDAYFWEERAAQDAFAELVRLLLDRHWPAIAQSTHHRDAFMVFALKLTALQHPLGSELTAIAANRLGGTGQGA